MINKLKTILAVAFATSTLAVVAQNTENNDYEEINSFRDSVVVNLNAVKKVNKIDSLIYDIEQIDFQGYGNVMESCVGDPENGLVIFTPQTHTSDINATVNQNILNIQNDIFMIQNILYKKNIVDHFAYEGDLFGEFKKEEFEDGVFSINNTSYVFKDFVDKQIQLDAMPQDLIHTMNQETLKEYAFIKAIIIEKFSHQLFEYMFDVKSFGIEDLNFNTADFNKNDYALRMFSNITKQLTAAKSLYTKKEYLDLLDNYFDLTNKDLNLDLDKNYFFNIIENYLKDNRFITPDDHLNIRQYLKQMRYDDLINNRNKNVVENIENLMQEKNLSALHLKFGKAHYYPEINKKHIYNTITQILEEKRISYIVIAPNSMKFE